MVSSPAGSNDPDPFAETDPVDATIEPLGRAAALGTLWMTGQKWVVRLSGFLTIAILTRLIPPEDFGVVAAAATITPMILLLADLGLSTYLVQADEVDSRILSTAFWFSVTAGFLLAVGLAAAAPMVADAFNIEGSASVLRVMSVSVFVSVLFSVPSALLRRRMEFRLLAIQMTIATFVAQIVAVILALQGAGAWALVAQTLVTQVLAGMLIWSSARWTPTLEFSAPTFVSMAHFGGKVVGVELVATSRAVIEAAIISNALGPAALGYLSIAQRLVQTAMDVSAAALVPVTTVVFAKVRDSPERLRAGYLRALRIGYAAVSPVLTLVAVGAPLIIPIIFGVGWDASIPVAQALAVAAILVLGAMVDHGLHYGAGRPGRWFAYALLIDVMTVASTAALAPRGLTWVALGFVVVALVATTLRWFLVSGLVACRPHELAVAFVISMIPVTTSAAAGFAVREATGALPALISLALVGMAVLLTHLIVVRVASRRVFQDVLEVVPLPQRLSWVVRLL